MMCSFEVSAVREQNLAKSIQEMLKSSNEEGFDISQVPGVANGADVAKFNDVLSSKLDSNVTLQNMRASTESLQRAGFSQQAAELRKMQGLTQETFEKLENMKVDAREKVVSERFDKFVNVVRDRLERVSGVVRELVSKKDGISQGDLMRIQYEVMQMSITLDVASKVGDKGSQALQTLFRNQ